MRLSYLPISCEEGHREITQRNGNDAKNNAKASLTIKG